MLNLVSIFNDIFKKYEASYYSDRICIHYKGIELFNDDYHKICFTVKNIKNQNYLDNIDSKYGVYVHYGKKYQNPQKYGIDISKYKIANPEKSQYKDKCYFSCEGLSDNDAINLFDYLVSLNDDSYQHELINRVNDKQLYK